jgi:hypothetical protein
MLQHLAAVILACLLSATAYSQDSGPGPVPAGGDTQKQYDVILYQRTTTQKGSMLFFAAADSSKAHTTGDFESDINGEQLTGTWRAYDLGTFAFWYAHASGASKNLTAFGWATPEFIVGQVTMSSGGGFLSFFNWFSHNNYFLHGNAATAPIGPLAN